MILITCEQSSEGHFEVQILRQRDITRPSILLWRGVSTAFHPSAAIKVALAAAESQGIINDYPRNQDEPASSK